MSAIPACELRDREHLVERQALDSTASRGSISASGAKSLERALDRVVREPRPRRVRRCGRGRRSVAVMLPRQPAWIALSGRLEHDRERRGVEQRRTRRRAPAAGSRPAGSSSRAKKRQRRRRGRSRPLGVEPARELEHHRDAALHVAGAEAVDGAVVDPARKVALGGTVSRWPARTTSGTRSPSLGRREAASRPRPRSCSSEQRRHERARRGLGDRGLVPAHATGCRRARACGAASRRRAIRRIRRQERGTIHRSDDASARHPAPGAEPERGFVLAVLARASTPTTSSAELRELARTAGVEPVGELVQQRAAARPAHATSARASSRS